MKISTMALIVFMFLAENLMGAPRNIPLWRHMASDVEIQASLAAIKRFNESQDQWNIVPDFIPEASYTLSIQAAAQAEQLPCIIEIDQPLVPNFAWSGYIKPLDDLLDADLLASINRSGKGMYQGRVYSVGSYDVSLALFTRKSLIKKIGARYPTIEHPWNKDEFMSFLNAVKATGEYQYPFDMRAQDTTEWIPYAWLPFMISWGADLIDRSDNQTVEGVLNSKEAVQFGEWIQFLVNQNYMDAHPQDDNGFINGDVGIQYGGSWTLSAYYSAFKDDLAVLPVPDFGHGPISGGGAWHWAMTENCQYSQSVKELLTFLMSAEEQSAISTVIGIFPSDAEVAERIDVYSKKGQWRMLFDFYNHFSMLRPETPAYSEISASYKKAMNDILNGMSPKLALDLAVENIQIAFERHENYPAH
ncbi:extracellular solute-binding protein [Amphritea pacifica]|uniref:extracellular solute-binding protein n=1 Tax=Amphritea pacifica TaxID=2811233 RepID=UPI001965D7E4|nr:extracellular solute-binding protein [Amphritea pacifica]MBN1008426.1 extracellular solute-binding protein [Amphritea pacifica]